MALEVGGPGTQNPSTTQDPSTGTALPAPSRKRRERLVDQPAGPPSGFPLPARRHRMIVRRLDLWSVLKISLCFYLCGLAVTMIAVIVLWVISSSLGGVHDAEEFMGSLLSAKDFRFLSAQILEGATLIGLVMVILLVIITLVAAAFYNLFAELIGGIEIVVEDE
jgi:hypothetical protein